MKSRLQSFDRNASAVQSFNSRAKKLFQSSSDTKSWIDIHSVKPRITKENIVDSTDAATNSSSWLITASNGLDFENQEENEVAKVTWSDGLAQYKAHDRLVL